MFGISPTLAAVQIAATLERINTGSGAASLQIYTDTRPASVTIAPGQDAQVVIALATPAGTITDGVLSLAASAPGGVMVLADGIPRWGRLFAADGAALADGNVTDAAHGGDIQLLGGSTPSGDTSPMLYAGGLVVLGTTALA